ncbi:MAG: hypothetical protein H7Z41_15555 [Cytophagales bacterium]|nr:hypothetical protein [Armatimonadota bacterium]
MIRTSYAVSPMKQLRLHLDLATRRTRRALERRRRTLFAELTETDRRKAIAGGDAYLLIRWREDVKRSRALFDSFFDQYDSLVGLLCLAAHQGIEPHLEEEYRERRRWFASNYPQRIQRLIEPYQVRDAADSVPGIWGPRSCDVFEALYLPSTIGAMLETDGGNLIGRMIRAQEALAAWEATIRREESAVATPIRYH